MTIDLLVFAGALLGASVAAFSFSREHYRRLQRLEASSRRKQFEQAVQVGRARRVEDHGRVAVRFTAEAEAHG